MTESERMAYKLRLLENRKYRTAPFDNNNGMEELLKKMIISLREKVEDAVPEKGAFPVVYEREDVSEMKIGLSHLILKVTNVPLEDSLDERYLELAAVNHPFPHGAESVVGYGSTQDILERLQDEGLLEELMKKVKILAEDVDYAERHPYG